MDKNYNISNLNKGIFKNYMKAKLQEENKLDTYFIYNITRIDARTLRKLIYELNEIDYESEYVPKSMSKYRLVQMLIYKYERLYEIMKDLVKKND